jgi:myo-inositol 2-dehydrogenase / D-chiro-inositol 1-dehydrogenase
MAKAEAYRSRFGYLRAYADLDEMVAREHPDAMSLIVPVKLTAPIAEALLKKGMPLLMEKPPGVDGAQVRRLIRAAARRGTPHLVGFNRRFMPMIRHLHRALRESGQPSAIHFIHYQLVRVSRMDADFSTTAIHAIDTVRFLAASDYRDVSIAYQNTSSPGGSARNIYLTGSFTSGAQFAIDICPTAGAVLERAEVHLADCSYLLHLPIWNQFDAPGRLLRIVQGRTDLDITGTDLGGGNDVYETGGFLAENSAFFDAVRAGRDPGADLQSALQPVEIMACIRRNVRRYRG